jgi:glyoxylase-like metal-dependent hydrolase (beta-lactamase superfamily II)/ferredoxin
VARYCDRFPENTDGDLFVDRSCIACDTCRRIAPTVFGGPEHDHAYVQKQPDSPLERRRALMALVSCPTGAIGSLSKSGVEEAAKAFPAPLSKGVEDVFYCGYAAESSFGAASWLVLRPEGNVLVDSPRYAQPLADRIAELGGIHYMFLTHGDDVADHEQWQKAFHCERVLHAGDVTKGTALVERKLEGLEPVRLAKDLVAIPVPGHTAGSTALLYRNAFIFTGDHLWGRGGHLHASRSVCWWSWEEQTTSVERLAKHRFEWVLPGHGRAWRATSCDSARTEVLRVAAAMRKPRPSSARGERGAG